MFLSQNNNACPLTYHCSICHQEECVDHFSQSSKLISLMAEKHVCFNCAFWLSYILHPKPNHIIFNGYHYSIFPYETRPFNRICGTGGKEYYIVKNTGEIIKTNNVHCNGKIPPRFISQLPDNAIFLSLPSYMKFKRDPFKCYAKGCWDRYHCLRYDKTCESDGPFNIIPKNHKIGNENCPSFININELKK